MEQTITQVDPQTLTLDAIPGYIQAVGRRYAVDIWLIGKALLRAKKIVQTERTRGERKGGWHAWCATELPVSYETARKWMIVAEKYPTLKDLGKIPLEDAYYLTGAKRPKKPKKPKTAKKPKTDTQKQQLQPEQQKQPEQPTNNPIADDDLLDDEGDEIFTEVDDSADATNEDSTVADDSNNNEPEITNQKELPQAVTCFSSDRLTETDRLRGILYQMLAAAQGGGMPTERAEAIYTEIVQCWETLSPGSLCEVLATIWKYGY